MGAEPGVVLVGLLGRVMKHSHARDGEVAVLRFEAVLGKIESECEDLEK